MKNVRIILLGCVIILFGTMIVLAIGGGFDEYGYNYNARLFNGWYGYVPRTSVDTENARLVMKWSKNWIPMEDEPVGAWCTNHFIWYSDDYDEFTWYGWDTRLEWTEKSLPPDADYRIEEFAKIMKVSDDSDEWARYEAGGAFGVWGFHENGVPKYVVFQDTIDIYYTSTGDLVATFDLCTAAPKGLGQPIF